MTLGERQWRHRHGRALRVMLAIRLLTRKPRTRADRRADADLRHELHTRYSNPSLIHNGRKPRNVR